MVSLLSHCFSTFWQPGVTRKLLLPVHLLRGASPAHSAPLSLMCVSVSLSLFMSLSLSLSVSPFAATLFRAYHLTLPLHLSH